MRLAGERQCQRGAGREYATWKRQSGNAIHAGNVAASSYSFSPVLVNSVFFGNYARSSGVQPFRQAYVAFVRSNLNAGVAKKAIELSPICKYHFPDPVTDVEATYAATKSM